MNPNPASLDNLRDIVEPTAVSWWPLAIGWWGMLAVFLIVSAVLAYRALRTWHVNAYRRAAIRELRSAKRVAEVSEILKRTALVAFPRTDVASLTGESWTNWLGETIGENVSTPISESLTKGVFSTIEGADVVDVSAFAAKWIHRHRSPC